MLGNSSLAPLQYDALLGVRCTGGTVSAISGLALALLCFRARRRTAEPQRRSMLLILLFIAVCDVLLGSSFPLSTSSQLWPESGYAGALCDASLIMWLVGSSSVILTASFAYFLYRALVHAQAFSEGDILAVASSTMMCGLILGSLILYNNHGAYKCTDWAYKSSFGIWGMDGFLGYSAGLAGVALFIAAVFFRILRAVHTAHRDTQESLLVHRSSISLRGSASLSALVGDVPAHEDHSASDAALQALEALEEAEQRAAATCTKLDDRLARYLAAYLLCNVPALVQTVCLVLVHYGYSPSVPFGVIAVRWTLQPLQGFFNLLVYWNQSRAHAADDSTCASHCSAAIGSCLVCSPSRWGRPSTMATDDYERATMTAP